MKTETPRTDECFSHEGNWDTRALRLQHLSRQLERELNEAKTDSLRLDWLLRPDVRILEKDESLGTWTASEILESRKSIDEAMEQADK